MLLYDMTEEEISEQMKAHWTDINAYTNSKSKITWFLHNKLFCENEDDFTCKIKGGRYEFTVYNPRYNGKDEDTVHWSFEIILDN